MECNKVFNKLKLNTGTQQQKMTFIRVSHNTLYKHSKLCSALHSTALLPEQEVKVI